MTEENSGPPSGPEAIDVIIPAIDKDLDTLPYVIDCLRKHVKHPINRIMIVSPNSGKIKALCARKNCTFVDERTVLPITKKHIRYRSSRWDRSGWLYQQLLKLNGDKLSSQRYFLVTDADTVMVRPHRFRAGGKTVVYTRHWSQPEYFNTYRKLMGTKARSRRSFVAHYMLFDRKKLAGMKKKIEAKHGTVWYKAIIRSINKKRQFGFSEFETYGNYLFARQPSGLLYRKCLNKSLSLNASGLSRARLKKLARSYRSLSFHKRKCYVRK
jgi:hypothetical protein